MDSDEGIRGVSTKQQQITLKNTFVFDPSLAFV